MKVLASYMSGRIMSSKQQHPNEHADDASAAQDGQDAKAQPDTTADAAKADTAEQSEQAEQSHEAGDEDAASERIHELELALHTAEQTVVEQREKAIRATAEMENIRRRASQDVEKAHKFALEKFANELLTTVDNLERALQLADQTDASAKSFIEGIELTYKGLVGTLEKFSIAPVGEVGEPFNPDLHQAMAMQESNEHPTNTVIAVMQKGYTLSGRLLRPAMVMVARNENGGVDTKA